MHSKCRPPRMQEQRPSFQMQIALLRMSHTGAKTVYYNTCCYMHTDYCKTDSNLHEKFNR